MRDGEVGMEEHFAFALTIHQPLKREDLLLCCRKLGCG